MPSAKVRDLEWSNKFIQNHGDCERGRWLMQDLWRKKDEWMKKATEWYGDNIYSKVQLLTGYLSWVSIVSLQRNHDHAPPTKTSPDKGPYSVPVPISQFPISDVLLLVLVTKSTSVTAVTATQVADRSLLDTGDVPITLEREKREEAALKHRNAMRHRNLQPQHAVWIRFKMSWMCPCNSGWRVLELPGAKCPCSNALAIGVLPRNLVLDCFEIFCLEMFTLLIQTLWPYVLLTILLKSSYVLKFLYHLIPSFI